LGELTKDNLERVVATVVGGWLGYGFFLVTHHPVWLPTISVIVAFLVSLLGARLQQHGGARLSIVSFVSGKCSGCQDMLMLLLQRLLCVAFAEVVIMAIFLEI